MARDGAIFVCQPCGAVHSKWSGCCDACGAWNSLVEEVGGGPPGALSRTKPTKTRGLSFEGLETEAIEPPRIETGSPEFDRVCGGGVVPGSAILLAGDPGVGKSTLLLQVCAPGPQPRAGRERRLHLRRRGRGADPRPRPAAWGSARRWCNSRPRPRSGTSWTRWKKKGFDLVVVDSIQTLWSDALEAGPGSVTQVRACAGELVRLAKKRGTAVILVGHVTKDGQIAGPRVVEHMVDAVLSFEGERGYPFRILRAAKNRFGATDEIGVFEMGDSGLREVAGPAWSCSWAKAGPGPQALRCLPVSRARVRCWSSSRPWWRRPPTERLAAPWSAGIPGAWPWCWLCSRRAAGLDSEPGMST